MLKFMSAELPSDFFFFKKLFYYFYLYTWTQDDATYRRAVSTGQSTKARLARRSLERDGETLLRNQSKIRPLRLQMAAGKRLLMNKVKNAISKGERR